MEENVHQPLSKIKVETESIPVIDIYFNRNCNLDCSYCYSPHSKASMTKEDLDIFLEALQEATDAKYFYTLKILGGDPTLYPYIDYFMEHLPDGHKIIFTTNAQKLLKLSEKSRLNLKDRMNFTISIHPDYFYSKNYLKNIKKFMDSFPEFNKNILCNLYRNDTPESFYGNDLMRWLTSLNLGNKIYVNFNAILTAEYYPPKNTDLYVEYFTKNIGSEYYENSKRSYKINGEKSNIWDIYRLHENILDTTGFKNRVLCELTEYSLFHDLTFMVRCIDKVLYTKDSKEKFHLHTSPNMVMCPNRVCDLNCYLDLNKTFIQFSQKEKSRRKRGKFTAGLKNGAT